VYVKTLRKVIGLGLFAAMSSVHAADVDWNGWSFDFNTNSDSSGLVLTDVHYNDKTILGRVSMPVMRVEYENDLCGPFADIFTSNTLTNPANGAQIAACNNQSVCRRTFTQNGESILEIGANWQIGEYQIYQTYYFSENGYFDSKIYSRGLQCQIQHSHHAHWMFDFDIDGSADDQIVRGDDDVQLTEFNDRKSDTQYWTIQDTVTGSRVRLTPSSDDGEPDDFSRWDVAGRAFDASEIGRWRNGARGDIGSLYNTPEQNIDGTDVVLWYVSHLPHSPEEGATIWHASGPRLEVLETVRPVPEAAPQATLNTAPVAIPEPVVDNNILLNGGFESATVSWSQCGPSDNAQSVPNNQAAGGSALKVSGGGCMYQEVVAEPGNEYALTCVAQRTGSEWTIIEMSYLDANFNNLSTELKQVTHIGAYTNYTLSGVAPVGTTYVAAVLFSEADSYFDSCSLTDASVASAPDADILFNGDFESNLVGWYSCADSSLSSVSAETDTGSGALQVTGGGCMYQEFPVVSGNSYTIDCRAKSEGTQFNTSVSLSMLDGDYAEIANNELSVESTDFGNYSVRMMAPADSVYGSVVVYSDDVAVFDNCWVEVGS